MISFTAPHNDRLSADTSTMHIWPEELEAPNLPVGYANGGENDDQAQFNAFVASTLQFAEKVPESDH